MCMHACTCLCVCEAQGFQSKLKVRGSTDLGSTSHQRNHKFHVPGAALAGGQLAHWHTAWDGYDVCVCVCVCV